MFVKVPLLPRVRHGSFICELTPKISLSVFIIECFWTVVLFGIISVLRFKQFRL